MNRLHREGRAQDKGEPFLRPEGGAPLPGEHTFAPDDEILPVRRADAQKGFRGRRQILMDEDRATLIQDTDVPRAGMEIAAAILFMLVRVEVHPGLLLGGDSGVSHHTAALRGRGGLDEYQTHCSAIRSSETTAQSCEG